MTKISPMLEVYCPTLFEQPKFAKWLNKHVGNGLATWHCGGEPGEMSDIFVIFDNGEGDYSPLSNPDGMPQFAWDFIAARMKAAGETYALVRLVNCEGDEDDDFTPAD